MRIIFATCSADEADALASRLVEEQLVGCVNVLPGVRAVYRWEGAVERDEEVILLMETTAERAPAATERLRALHSYDVPKIVVLAPESCDEPYRRWLEEVTRPPA